MATRTCAQISNVKASHALYVTQAGVVADVIAEAAQHALVSVS